MSHPFSGAASVFLVTIGVLVLAGWAFDIASLKGLPGPITMKANAAVSLLACGLALGGVADRRRWVRVAGRACAVLAGAIGALTLSQHLAGWDLHIDELLFPETPGSPATMSPGRMGPNASTSLTLASIALFCLYRGRRRSLAVGQILAALVTVFALVPLVGYLYGATQLYAIAQYTGIALHTGLALFVLGLGLLAVRSDAGPVAALMRDAPHAVMGRRLLVAAIVVPITLGYLRLVGERLGWYDTGFGAALIAVIVVVLLSLTIWRTAIALDRSEGARRSVEAARDALLISERQARERAERADRAKDEFIAALSHELRTPLNAVLGWMQMMEKGVLADGSRTRATEAIARNAGMLARLIEDLLDSTRITSGQLAVAREPVGVLPVVQAAAESVLPAAAAKGVNVTVSAAVDLPPVVGDAQRLQQIVWNLLSNAIKFSPAGATVTLELAAEAETVIVRVRDQGEGIAREFLPHVFDRFRQEGSTPDHGHSGLGLGLFIVHHLVQEHGGTITAESDGPGRGAVFTVRLPAAKSALPHQAAPSLPVTGT